MANMIMLYNVDAMTKEINELQKEGETINDDVLSILAPYRTSHINCLGQYHFRPTRAIIGRAEYKVTGVILFLTLHAYKA